MTPITAPTSTSLGASAPSATRPSPASTTTTAATSLPRCRQRPSGTRVYSTTTRVAAKAATCTEGRAQPPQPVRISTPNGRGRWVIGPTS